MDELEEIRQRKMRGVMEKATGKSSGPLVITDALFDEVAMRHPFLVVDCWAAWCAPCRMVAPVIEELAKHYAGRVVFGKLNVDENPATATRFGIRSIPTLLLVKNGREVDRIVGAVPRAFIEERLRAHSMG